MIYTNKSEFNTVNYWKLTLEYHGMFKNNMRHGLGKMISSNFFSKNILEGYWENDVMIKEFKGVEIELNENLNDLSCRICLENVSKFEMFAPCNCKGSQKWTHRACLIGWLKLRVLVDENMTGRCECCREIYNVPDLKTIEKTHRNFQEIYK